MRAVGARGDDVVLQHDRAATGGAQEARVHVAAGVGLLPAGVVAGERPVAVALKPERRRAHRDEALEAVPAVDVEVPRHRAQAVRRVEVAVPLQVLEPPPEPDVLPVEEQRSQVVDVGALGVVDLAQHSRPDEVPRQHLAPAVVAVLEHDAVPPRPLGGVHELPALVEGDGGRDLDRGVGSSRHGGERHRDVPAPGCRDVDEVEVAPAAQGLEVPLSLRVDLRPGPPRFLDPVLHPRRPLGADVAHGLDLDALDPEEVSHVARAARAAADDAHPDDRALFEGNAHHRGALGGRGCRALGRAGAAERQGGGGAGGGLQDIAAGEGTSGIVGHGAPPRTAGAYAGRPGQRKRSVSIPCFFTA